MVPPRGIHLKIYKYISLRNRYQKDITELAVANLEKFHNELFSIFQPYLWLDCQKIF
jgi:hypothetical protein